MNLKKRLRIMGVEAHITPVQKIINSMTNWQNSQWLRSGADPKHAAKFAKLKKVFFPTGVPEVEPYQTEQLEALQQDLAPAQR
jgi:hypothetical protein